MSRTKNMLCWANDNHIWVDNGIDWEYVQLYLAEQKNKQLTQNQTKNATINQRD